MAVSDDFFEIDGILLEGGAALYSGDTDPSIGIDLPVGSIFLRTNGEQYRKIGPGAGDWRLQLIARDKDIDGGAASTIFTPSQMIDGGNVNG